MERSQIAAISFLGAALASIFWPDTGFIVFGNPEPTFEATVTYREQGLPKTIKIPRFKARSIGHARDKALMETQKRIGVRAVTRFRVVRV